MQRTMRSEEHLTHGWKANIHCHGLFFCSRIFYFCCLLRLCASPGGGTQNRTLKCRMPHDSVYHGMIQPDATLCPPPGVGDVGDGVGQPGVTAVSDETKRHTN